MFKHVLCTLHCMNAASMLLTFTMQLTFYCAKPSRGTVAAGTSPNEHANGHKADAPTEPSASKQWQQDASNFTDEKLNLVLRGLDDAVARLLDAMPANGMLVLFTCQGDTAEYRRLQVRLFCTVESCAYLAFAISDHVYITLRHKHILWLMFTAGVYHAGEQVSTAGWFG